MIPVSQGIYRLFDPGEWVSLDSSDGFDAWAEEYGRLPATNPIFRLTKELLYRLVLEEICPRLKKQALPWRMLDFNCGPGNDFPFFLEQGFQVVGCDGSPGMLRVAWKKFSQACQDKRVMLYLGRAERLQPNSFDGQTFDLIFSTTGGFSYLDDEAFVRAHQVLYRMLTAGGVLLTAHLAPVCLSETVYYLFKGHPRLAFRRWSGTLTVNIRGRQQRMWLRSPARVKKLLRGLPRRLMVRPVLCWTPPFQTGYRATGVRLPIHRALEYRSLRIPGLAFVADQVACLVFKR
ncbi:MAG: class I SAM-dependent methyltransferase [Calditrichaeota bacterium]|nr:class I SAM-dependent methyltransferase [Calditrichota bacterium]